VWFGSAVGEVKDLRSGQQVAADASSWTPPEDDRRPRVMATSS
jgi:histidyl-tRNA synthetase